MDNFEVPSAKDPAPLPASEIPTVAVVCMAIVQKSEYDAIRVREILPARVIDNAGQTRVTLPSVMVVGTSSHVLDQVMRDFQRMWSKYNDMLERALRAEGETDDRTD